LISNIKENNSIYLDFDSALKKDSMKVIGKIDNYSMDNKDILLEGKILDTPTSKIYEELLGDNLVVSPIGYGRVNDNNVMKNI